MATENPKPSKKARVKGVGNEFKDFIMRGNVVDIAIGLTVGVAFNGVVNSLVNDIIMPPISYLTGGTTFEEWYIPLSNQTFESLEAAQAAGVPIIMYGHFISQLLDFLIIALSVFVVIKLLARLHITSMPEKKK
ncbi:MAG: large conductance mechanosensitive channel protein MscL [Candidatus Dojkabacteria bacterium]|nr:MAG: large conductance mechanosensitive channel protein MscL [Candidatus Dojkabacteria bacterium]